MGTKRKSQKKKSKKLKTSAMPKRPITKSACRDEAIWELYKRCSKIGKGDQVRVYLQNVDFSIDIKYKENLFKELKKKEIIKDYELKTEMKKLPPQIIEKTTEPNLELLPLVSSEQLKNATEDYSTIDNFRIDYVVIIKKCNPQKVKEYLKEDYKRIKKRIKIENVFKEEEKRGTLRKCDELRFGLDSGYVIYGDTLKNFLPGGCEYKLLRALIVSKNCKLTYKETNEILSQGNNRERREIADIITDIRQKLDMAGDNPVNEDLFDCHAGYTMNCDTDT